MSVYRRTSGTSEDWLMLLESSYHHLCRSVRPEAFFSWLRSKGVFTLQDQEEVEHKYMTTIMKSGHLIDIIKTKGYQGFTAFMEVVEYVYPETFSILTGKQPRTAPKEFEPNASIGSSVVREKRGHALSAEILGQMGDLVNVLSKANAVKKEELEKLQSYVKKLQEENKAMCDENHSLLLKFKDSQEEIDQLKLKLTVLMSKHEHDTAERKTVLSECERLCVLKDKYMVENQKLREERDELQGYKMHQTNEHDIQRSQTCRIPTSPINRLRQDLVPKDKKKPGTSQKQDANLETKSNSDCACPAETSTSEAKNSQTNEQSAHQDDLEMKTKEWESQYTMLQERYNCLLVNLDEVKTERNQMHHKLDDLQSMYEKEREENQRLVTDCNKYLEKFCNMESQMSSLKQEIDELRAVAGEINPVFNDLPSNQLLQNGSNDKSSISPKRDTNSRKETSPLLEGQEKKPTSKPVEVIDQTPGLCPSIKRQLVVTNKKPQSTSNV